VERQDRPDGQNDATRLLECIRALVRRFSVSERSDVSCCGMTVAQAATIELLASEGPARLGEVGRRLGIQPSTLTRNLARLEERSLVERVGDPRDGRAFRVRLTAAGQGAARSLKRQEEAFARTIVERLPAAKRREVLTGLEELLGAVRGATDSCCPGAFDHLMRSFPRGNPGQEGGSP